MKSFKSYIKLLRPTQWIKNGFVLMPLIFSERLGHVEDVLRVSALVLAFCLASSATYIFNDYMDMEQDKVHPLKKNRPLASGAIAPGTAFVVLGLLLILMLSIMFAINSPTLCYALVIGYLILHVAYSYKLKDIVIIDVLTIAAGFSLRVIAGAAVISVSVSSWLLLCTFSIAIFLALGKRRHEVVILCDDASCHRPVLENYNVTLLDQLLQTVTTATLIFYCLYSVHWAGTAHSDRMIYTIPLVVYGVFRYMYLIYLKEDGGSPTVLLLTDPPLLGCAVVWLTACIWVIYF
jgi:4-hydroxybenzoate polyprenyltransferase